MLGYLPQLFGFHPKAKAERYELAHRLRSSSTWVYAVLLFAFAAANGVDVGTIGAVNANVGFLALSDRGGVDPPGLGVLKAMTLNRSATELNSRLVGVSAGLLLNRFLWLRATSVTTSFGSGTTVRQILPSRATRWWRSRRTSGSLASRS